MKTRRILILLFAASILSTGCGRTVSEEGTEVTGNEERNVSINAITDTTEEDNDKNNSNSINNQDDPEDETTKLMLMRKMGKSAVMGSGSIQKV